MKYAILGDIHANLEALAVILETLGDSENFKAAIASLSALVAKEAVISEEPVIPVVPTM
mgnify:CR=1 FL=1